MNNRILFVKNLPYSINNYELYELFGRFGSVQQIRLGNNDKTKGSAFVVYDDVESAKNAYNSLKGFNCGGRYLIVHFYKKDAEIKKQLKEQEFRFQTVNS